LFVHDLDRLGDEIATLASHLSAATARWLRLIAEFDDRGGWVRGGYKTCAQWLGWQCGLAPSAAREHVRVAHRLRELPHVAACFERGELSYSKVRALTRIDDDVDEQELLRVARAASASQLERIVRGYRTCVAIEQDANRQWAEREFSWSWDETGALVVRGRVPAEQGALLVAAVEAARNELGPPPPEDPAGASAEAGHRSTSVRARNADALLALAQSSLAENAGASSADVYQVVVHVDSAALIGGDGDRAESDDPSVARCELEDGNPLPREAVRRLGCDASIVRVLERDGKPLSIGRKTRTIPPALRRALRMRDRGCAFPGCTQVHHTDAHHIQHWADGGRTDIDNLVQLCRHHHRLLHEGGFRVRRTKHGVAFANPDGKTIPQAPRQPRGDCTQITKANGRHGVNASAEALYPVDSVGERFELGWTVEGLLESRRPRRE
jgi:hypothetical protein